MNKSDVVRILDDIATLLEFSEVSPFEIMAFRNGAQNLDDWEGDLKRAAEDGTLTDIPGIGKGLASVISELVLTGRSQKNDELRRLFPEGLLEVLAVPGLGVKKVKLLYEALGIDSLERLEEAARAHRIQTLKGFGARTEESILRRVERARRRKEA